MAKGTGGSTELLLCLSILCIGSYGSVKAACYQAPSYDVTEGKYSCRLHQKNWASEAYFELTLKHCLKEPTVNLFIRNFHGIDEINTDFNKRFSRWKTQLFNGKTSQLVLKFALLKADGKYTKQTRVQITLIYVPRFGRPDTQQLLIAVFPFDDRSDCIWAETLEVHDQIFFGGGLCLAFILMGVAVCCYRRHKSRRYQPALTEKVRL